jgi:hypothetical protein
MLQVLWTDALEMQILCTAALEKRPGKCYTNPAINPCGPFQISDRWFSSQQLLHASEIVRHLENRICLRLDIVNRDPVGKLRQCQAAILPVDLEDALAYH